MISLRLCLAACVAAAVFAAPEASAQSSNPLSQLFGGRERQQVPPADMQGDQSELIIRLERLENQLRQLTGVVEQLQHQNQQLQQQVRGPGADNPPPRGPTPATRPPINAPQAVPQLPPPGLPATGPSNRRGDAFDPNSDPDAPGAPRTLGNPNQVASQGPSFPPQAAQRPLNQPMDLSPNAPNPGLGPGNLPPPGPAADNQPGPVGPQATLPPSGSPKDEYDLAYGYILRRDYALAEQSFRAFLSRHADDRNAPLATYWLGESLFAQKKHNDAAEIFLDVYNKYPNSQRAPDSLLRLGQSLAALGKKEAACASLGAVLSKYPKASPTVKKNAEEEQKRARC